MPRHPILMALYTNDAVEVRYSDDSRLHLLPCGTSFSYHTAQEAHPVHGLSSIQQRCCFVTSTYKDMVLTAMDFRNRFSERPFLASDMIEPDQVVNLYANIEKIAWPKRPDSKHCEILDNGSVRVTSVDEFCSLILSSHRKDFTVCYLSHLSEEKIREKSKHKRRRSPDNLTDPNKPSQNCVEDSNLPGNVHDESQRSNTSDEVALIDQQRMNRLAGDTRSRHSRENQRSPDDLNISPITQASCADSPQSHASGSPITPRNAVADTDAKFRPFSTPTEGLDEENPICTPFGKTAIFQNYQRNCEQAYTRESGDKHLSDGFNADQGGAIVQQTRCRTNRSDTGSRSAGHTGQAASKCHNKLNRLSVVDSRPSHNGSSLSNESSGSESGTQTRRRYCWVTRHVSCDECPLIWSHAVKMAQDVAQNGLERRDKEEKENVAKAGKSNTGQQSLRRINRSECTFSSLPLPLPLTCPGQHLHKSHTIKTYTDDKDPVEDPSTLSQGRLKILLINGTVYRLVRLPTIKLVEVYPGDGSILISQGLSAHFFLHIIPQQGKLEERTYSIKSLPSTMAGTNSVKNLIARAHRFLAHILQEDTNMPVPQGLYCWKHEERLLIQPVATSVLEECDIPGHGKFTALSNGQVRIVFPDRTSLDMTCDFSRRLNSCLRHSTQGGAALILNEGQRTDTCRLLLPNGQYVLVEVSQPGNYKRYIDMATEWAKWVNTSPENRKFFYKDKPARINNISVERELQKISCFNYIVDNTVLKKQDTCESSADVYSSGAFKPYNTSNNSLKPGILRNTDQKKSYSGGSTCDSTSVQRPRTVLIRSPPSDGSQRTISDYSTTHSSTSGTESVGCNFIGQSSFNRFKAPPTSLRPNPIGQLSNQQVPPLDGFNAVREALLRTSSVIKDIDSLLHKD